MSSHERKELILAISCILLWSGRALVSADEDRPPAGPITLGEWLTKMRSMARRRRLPFEGIDALRRITGIWDAHVENGEWPINLPDDELRDFAHALMTYKSWLKTHFPDAVRK